MAERTVRRFNAKRRITWRAEAAMPAGWLCLFNGAAAINETAWAPDVSVHSRQHAGCRLLASASRQVLAQNPGTVALPASLADEAVVPPAASLVHDDFCPPPDRDCDDGAAPVCATALARRGFRGVRASNTMKLG